MSQLDWSKFSLKIYISAPMQKVYDAWTTRANLENWFLRKAEFKMPDGTLRENNDQIQKEDTYEWMWHGYPDTTAEHGVVTEANGKDRFQFIFGK
ncbi:MAG: SRPBCC domain-containing protein [Chitinophagales bacterium]